MSWDDDIQEWSKKSGRDPSRQKNILVNEGWDPKKYQPSMKAALFDYLDKWHTLSLKNMPSPATLRKNPFARNPAPCLHLHIYEDYLEYICESCGALLPNVDLNNYEQY
jgi:hypothetical protein